METNEPNTCENCGVEIDEDETFCDDCLDEDIEDEEYEDDE